MKPDFNMPRIYYSQNVGTFHHCFVWGGIAILGNCPELGCHQHWRDSLTEFVH